MHVNMHLLRKIPVLATGDPARERTAGTTGGQSQLNPAVIWRCSRLAVYVGLSASAIYVPAIYVPASRRICSAR